MLTEAHLSAWWLYLDHTTGSFSYGLQTVGRLQQSWHSSIFLIKFAMSSCMLMRGWCHKKKRKFYVRSRKSLKLVHSLHLFSFSTYCNGNYRLGRWQSSSSISYFNINKKENNIPGNVSCTEFLSVKSCNFLKRIPCKALWRHFKSTNNV